MPCHGSFVVYWPVTAHNAGSIKVTTFCPSSISTGMFEGAMGLRGALPSRAWDVVAGNVFRVYNSMDHFTGRPASKQGAGSAKEQ